MTENRLNFKFKWKIFLAQLRDNLKSSPSDKTENITHFNLTPYQENDSSLAEQIKGFISKSKKFEKVLEIVEEKHSEYDDVSREHPEVYVLDKWP